MSGLRAKRILPFEDDRFQWKVVEAALRKRDLAVRVPIDVEEARGC